MQPLIGARRGVAAQALAADVAEAVGLRNAAFATSLSELKLASFEIAVRRDDGASRVAIQGDVYIEPVGGNALPALGPFDQDDAVVQASSRPIS
jgi:hypothetical protein